MRIQDFFKFIKARHQIYVRRQEGQAPPWTADPILRKYKFCNVYRELDRGTIWLRENWRDPHRKAPDLWFALTVARLINLPDSLAVLGFPVPWDAGRFKRLMRARKKAGERVFSGAYMIRADAARPGKLKTDYLADRVLTPLWKEREDVRPRAGDRLSTFFARLRAYRDMGPFIAGQIVADAKFAPPLYNCEDWWTWATPGPGSLRGMNRVVELPIKTSCNTETWFEDLNLLQMKLDPLIQEAGMPRLSAQDLQNCLCEFDKYERVRRGEGRPKALYPGV
jgi:hypothetical protein